MHDGGGNNLIKIRGHRGHLFIGHWVKIAPKIDLDLK